MYKDWSRTFFSTLRFKISRISRLRYTKWDFPSTNGWLLVKPGNSTEEKSHFLSLYSISCDLLSWLHNWQSFLVEVTRLTPFWYTRKPFFGKISDCLFLSRLMITFVLRLIPLRKLVLFSFHMLTSPTTCHKKRPTKSVLTFSFCLRFVGKAMSAENATKNGQKTKSNIWPD